MARSATRIRPVAIPFFVGLFFFTFGIAVFGTYLQLEWSLNSYDVWAFWGGVAFALALGMFGFKAYLELGTAPFISASGLNPQGDWAPIDVVLHEYPVDPTAIRRLGATKKVDADIISVRGIRDAQNREVPVQVVGLGGINAYGIHIMSGRVGFLILRGNQVIPMGDAHRGEFYFTPRVFRTLHISQVEEEVIDALRRHPKFEYGKSPIYDLGPFGKGFIEFLWDNEAEVRRYLDQPHDSSPIGVADNHYFQALYQSALSELWTYRSTRRHHLDAIQSQAEVIAGGARRAANVLRGREPVEPAWEETGRRPVESGNEE